VFSVDPADAPIGWIAITWYMFTVGPCPFRCYISDRIRSGQLLAAEGRKQEDSSYELQVAVAAETREQASKFSVEIATGSS
jgi:hypothetical protein